MAADIDIDVADRDRILALIAHTPARQHKGDSVMRHASGIYVTAIPKDPMTGLAAMDYREAESRGYFKIDVLNMSVYQLVRDQQHMDDLMSREPPWSRLWQDPDWAKDLVHVGDHVPLLQSMRPDTIPRMAALISVIRPGKAHLQNQPWSRVFQEVWDGDSSRGFIFKKSHAMGYGHLVALHMNLLAEPR